MKSNYKEKGFMYIDVLVNKKIRFVILLIVSFIVVTEKIDFVKVYGNQIANGQEPTLYFKEKVGYLKNMKFLPSADGIEAIDQKERKYIIEIDKKTFNKVVAIWGVRVKTVAQSKYRARVAIEEWQFPNDIDSRAAFRSMKEYCNSVKGQIEFKAPIDAWVVKNNLYIIRTHAEMFRTDMQQIKEAIEKD